LAEFRKNTGETTWEGGSGEKTTAKKVITFSSAMSKEKVVSFSRKIG